jgi:formylglycine-generating enzyme required for sulfatase activity
MAVTAGGLFALALTTPAGTATAQVFFLQGQDGVCSSTVTDLTVTGTLAVTGTTTLATAQVQDLQVTGSYGLPPCPEGYTEDLTAFGGVFPGVHVSVNLASGDELVKVGSFWIDRYEASLWSGATCSGTQYGGAGGTDDYPAGFPDNGNFTTPVYSCSLPGVTPSRMVTWFQAEQACALAGKRLCGNDEWQLAVAGTYDEGTAEANGTSQCRIAATNTGPRQTGQAGATPSSTLHCISAWGAEDLIGNLQEWVADWYVTGMPWQASDGEESAGVWGASYGNDSTAAVNGSAWHGASPFVDGIPAAGMRGGGWLRGSAAGAFNLNLSAGPSNWAAGIGARCCRGR